MKYDLVVLNRTIVVLGVFCLIGCANTADKDDHLGSAAKVASERFVVTLDAFPVERDVIWWYAAFTPDGRRFVADGAIYDAQTGQRLARIARKDGGYVDVRTFAISPDGATIAFADQGFRGPGNTEHWYGVSFASLDNGKVEQTIEVPDIAIGRIYFPSKLRVIALSHDKVYMLDVNRGKVVHSSGHVNSRTTAVSPDGKHYAQLHSVFQKEGLGKAKADPSHFKYFVSVHNLESGEETARLPETSGSAKTLEWTPDGKHIVVSARPCMTIMDVSAKSVTTSPELSGWQPTIPPRMLSDRYLLLVGEKYERNAFLDLVTGSLVSIDTPAKGENILIAIAPDGMRIIVRMYIPSGTPANTVYLGSMQSGRSMNGG